MNPNDPMSFFQQMWAGNTEAPFSLEQVDKKINDLRLVENWLQLNLQMVQTSIASFETQKNFMQGMQQAANTLSNTAANTSAMPAMTPEWWGDIQKQFVSQFPQWLTNPPPKNDTPSDKS